MADQVIVNTWWLMDKVSVYGMIGQWCDDTSSVSISGLKMMYHII